MPTLIILQFIFAFGVWILADGLGLSAVLTMVCFAVWVARYVPSRTPASLRLPSYAVWETAVFLLNVLAFVFIGLQVRPILAGLDADTRAQYLRVAGLVLATVIVIRMECVMLHSGVVIWKNCRFGFRPARAGQKPRRSAAASWCRGRAYAGSSRWRRHSLCPMTESSFLTGTSSC